MTEKITPLRQRMIDDLTIRNLSPSAKKIGASGLTKPVERVSGAHDGYQAAAAEDLHHALHVVGQHVQRHFGADVLQCLHLEVG